MIIKVQALFDYGQKVKLINGSSDGDNPIGIVIAFILQPGNTISYRISWGHNFGVMTTEHYEFELELA
jgi:hypothetical protein